MASAQLGSVLRHLRAAAGTSSAASDRELLDRFCTGRDEPAFAQLLRRHGPMVLHVGRRVLGRLPDAEDVFQATFLLLARKAASIRKRESVGSWLHGVAYRLALQARHREARRGAHEREAAEMRKSATTTEAAWRELRETLDRALHELPEHHRAVLLLCYLEGQTQEEAARRLGCPLGTVRSGLARARTALRRRLARRGLVLSAAALVTALAADGVAGAVPAGLLKSTREAALRFAIGDGATGLVSARAAALVEGGLKTMFATRTKAAVALLLAVGLAAGLTGALAQPGDPAGRAEAAPEAKAPGRPAEEKGPRTDAHGDPLPDGAAARLGTVRLRHGTYVTAISFSPDAKQLVSGDADHTLCLWDVATGKKLRQFGRREGGGWQVAFSPDGKLVAAAGYDAATEIDGVVYLWDTTTWKTRRHELKVPRESFHSLAFSADSTAVAAGTAKGTVFVWDTTTGKEGARLEGHQGYVRCVAFSPDGKKLASGGDDKTARLWDLATGKELHQLIKGHTGPVVGLVFARDGKTVATGSFAAFDADEPLHVWDVATGQEVRQIKGGSPHGFQRLALTADGKTLISGGMRRLRAYDWATGKELRRYGDDARRDVGGFVALSADGKTLASAIWGAIRLWATDTGQEIVPPASAGHRAEVRSVAFAPDGRALASGGTDDVVCLWDAAGKELRRLPLEPYQEPSALAFSPDGRLLAVGTRGGVRFWEPATGKESLPALKGKKSLLFVAFSPDGKSLIAGEGDGAVRVWDVAARKEVRAFGGVPGLTTAMAVSPDGKLLALGGDDGAIRTWDFAAGKELRRWQGHGNEGGANWVAALAFSPDGATLASGGADATVRLWDVAGGKELMRSDREKGHTMAVQSLVFSPNGRMFASGSSDHTVRLWEVVTRQERRHFDGHAGWVQAVAFAGDGRTLASASKDTTVLLWDATGAARPARPAAKLTAEELKALWADLASNDARQAYAAIGALTGAPAQAVSLLQGHLRPVAAVDAKRVDRLLADLDSDEFAVREKAAKELEGLSDGAEPALRKALAGKPSADVRQRVQGLLEKLDVARSPERLRGVRALEVLEYVGTEEAKKALQELAKGMPEARLTREAKAALDRLNRHTPSL